MKNINVREEQINAYKSLINRGVEHEDLIGLIDDEVLDEIRRIVNEQESEQLEEVEYEQYEEVEQDEEFNLEM